MKKNRIKLVIATLLIVPCTAVLMFSSKPLGRIASADGEFVVADFYKAKCAMCHSAKAEKQFDPAKTDDELAETIMKGKKGEKPPFMPSFEAKAMKPEEAKALVAYMKELRKPAN